MPEMAGTCGSLNTCAGASRHQGRLGTSRQVRIAGAAIV
jgi:hypothetical protein